MIGWLMRDLRSLIVAVAVLVTILSMAWCSVEARGHRRERAALAELRAGAAVVASDQRARDVAADERSRDEQITFETQETLNAAVDALPQARPSARRLALACARLRGQGTDEATVPAVCRSEGSEQAATTG